MSTSRKGVHPVRHHFGSLLRREIGESLSQRLPYVEHIRHAALAQFVQEVQTVLEPRLPEKVRLGALVHSIPAYMACTIIKDSTATLASTL